MLQSSIFGEKLTNKWHGQRITSIVWGDEEMIFQMCSFWNVSFHPLKTPKAWCFDPWFIGLVGLDMDEKDQGELFQDRILKNRTKTNQPRSVNDFWKITHPKTNMDTQNDGVLNDSLGINVRFLGGTSRSRPWCKTNTWPTTTSYFQS